MSMVFDLLEKERKRQENSIQLIASENYVSEDILRALGSCATNKYSEGYPGKRYYGGCEVIDEIETYCQQKWQEVFKTNYHVNVQPHSGSQANMAIYLAMLRPGDTILSMNLSNGGHLSHGSPVNFSGKLYDVHFYNVDENGFIDYKDLENKIRTLQPKLVIAGASAYSRYINYSGIRDIIDLYALETNGERYPIFMVDMAHVAGLIAAGVHPSPFGYADIITTTTHKTLRGPRGALIFCKPEYAKKIDSAVFPGTQGGPLQNVIAAKAVCAEEALQPQFRQYTQEVVRCSKAMARRFEQLGYKIITGGTDNHMFLLDLTSKNVTGRQVQEELDKHNINVNKNCIPGEKLSPREASGIRIGTPAMVTRGWHEQDFINAANTIDEIIKTIAK